MLVHDAFDPLRKSLKTGIRLTIPIILVYRDALWHIVHMQPRPDLVSPDAPPGLTVFQITDTPGTPASHVYMEAQVFTPDSKSLVLHWPAHPHGCDRRDPLHRYYRCDLEDGFRMTPLTDEVGAIAPSITPDGQWMYYFVVADSRVNGGRFFLKRVRLDGSSRETVLCVDRPLPGAATIPSNLYILSTLSSDGERLATGAFLGDGNTDNAPWGLLVFDLEKATGAVVHQSPTLLNLHPQYCRSIEPEASRDILIQENHGGHVGPDGTTTRGTSGNGVDIHVIRDDGSLLRDIPVGRDGDEYCQGHQCWRGRTSWTITGTGIANPRQKHGWGQELIESLPAPPAGHLGRATPGAIRNDMSRSFDIPDFRHFQTDRDGRHLLTDCGPYDEGGRLFLASLGEPGRDPASGWTHLLDLHASNQSPAHAHPFLSPDGIRGFFNSDETGTLQAYMVAGW
ncbi:MAG: hypothetical protein A2340_16280 [Lentisphaerae bacterium RIFOXYB12_FULL_60_10]|nr:MAG: hypothetical protein A2340_16280 [Lentisphaerae bacterium RIFOXYB12_FULL_60_10]